jgi:hypothetical protein
MQFLVLSLLLVAMTGDYLAHEHWVPGFVPYLQEIIAAIIAAYVVAAGAANRFRYVHTSYGIALVALVMIAVCGVLVNSVETGPIFAGVRTHARALPLFFLAAVWAMREEQLRTQLKFLLLLALVQLPLAYHQRATTFVEKYLSGDRTVGTLNTSGSLSIFLICVACVLTGLLLRRRLKLWQFVPLFLLVLTPTMLNETKATLLLLPVGLLTTFIAGSAPGRRMRNGVAACLFLAIFGAIFVPVYDYYMKPRWGYGIVEFMTMRGRLETYLDKGADMGAPKAGRVDALVVPLTQLARDPGTLAFGYGVGNASDSALGSQFTGRYFHRFEPFLMSAASTYILEIGLLGFGIILLFCWLVFRDTRYLIRRDEGLIEAFAVGWTGVIATMMLGLFYNDALLHGSLTFLFWYFSGVIAAEKMRLVLDPREGAPVEVSRRPSLVRPARATG